MPQDGLRIPTLHSENETLYCSVRDGVPALEYFTLRDVYSTFRVNLEYSDLEDICKFLDKWGSEPITIIQPYSTKVNGEPMFCAIKLEYVDNPDSDKMIRKEFQRITFYAECWGNDLEDSLKEDKYLIWTSWDDYYFWDGFEKIRAFMHEMRNIIEVNKAGIE